MAIRARSFRPRLEVLESRNTPTAFFVSNSNNSGAGSFRQAILDANALSGADQILFTTALQNNPIRLLSALPDVLDKVTIDGSQLYSGGSPVPNTTGKPLIEIDGSGITGPSFLQFGFYVQPQASGSLIRGLVMNRFGSTALIIQGLDIAIEFCYFGLTADGMSRASNSVDIAVGGLSRNTRIGGTTEAQRNVISGATVAGIFCSAELGTSVTKIQGNYIGTTATGQASVGNAIGIKLSGQVQGSSMLDNVISGNTGDGIYFDGLGAGVHISRNKIGVAADGVAPLANGANGINVVRNTSRITLSGKVFSDNLFIGGGDYGPDHKTIVRERPADGNLIGFNGLSGVRSTGGAYILANSIFASPKLIDYTGTKPSPPLSLQSVLVKGIDPKITQFGLDITRIYYVEITGTYTGSVAGSLASFEFYYSTNVPGGSGGVPQNLTWFSRSDLVIPPNKSQPIDILFPVPDPQHPGGIPFGAYLYVTVTDDDGTGIISCSRFSVPALVPTPPTVRDDALTPRIKEGSSAVLSGRLIDPDPGDILGLRVNWGDGTPVQTYHPGLDPFAIPHVYANNGTYNVEFTWFDNHGGSNTRTRQVIVDNMAPTLANAFLSGISINPGRGVYVFSAQVVDPGKKDRITVQIDWGDGVVESLPITGQGKAFHVHLYKKPGPAKATVTVTDDDGDSTTYLAVPSTEGFVFQQVT